MTALSDYSDTELVLVARQGQSDAFSILFERWFDRVWNVSRNILRDNDLASESAQDTFVLAWKNLDQLRNPDAFGGWLLRSSRNRALNKLQKEQRSRSESGDVMTGYQDKGMENPAGIQPMSGPVESSESRDQQSIVWAATAALGMRDASIMDLHLRHGLDAAELADELGVTTNNAHQLLYRLKTKLGDVIGNYLLWRDGQVSCEGLRTEIAGAAAFDQSVSKAVKRHQKSCEACSKRRAAMVSPAQLFASAPFIIPPLGLKEQIAASLQAQGVPAQLSLHSAGAQSVAPHYQKLQQQARPTTTSTARNAGQVGSATKVVASVGAVLLAIGLGWWLLRDGDAAVNEAGPASSVEAENRSETTVAGLAGGAGAAQTNQPEGVVDDETNDGDDTDGQPELTSPESTSPPSTTSPQRPTTTNPNNFLSPDSETKRVPNVIGLRQPTAIAELEDEGFTVDIQIRFLGSGAPEIGTVIGQTPSSGTESDVGSEVTITVARAEI